MKTVADSVLITGTTSGVGLALLEYYVRSGAHVVAVNRRRVQELESRYPGVRFECVDVRSAEAVARLLATLGDAVPNVLVLNAGINQVDNDESFDLAAYQAVIDTNLYGVLNFVAPLTQLAPCPTPRHVVAVSSMASYVGNPYALGYATSKQALTACFDVWSRMFAGTDLVFQQVLLGPVQTSIFTMEDKFPAWMTWLRSVGSASLEDTAEAIARLARSSRKKLIYPGRAALLYVGMWLSRVFVPGFFRGERTLAGRVRRQVDRPLSAAHGGSSPS